MTKNKKNKKKGKVKVKEDPKKREALFFKRYDDRNGVIYDIGNRKAHYGKLTMIRCSECGKKFVYKKDHGWMGNLEENEIVECEKCGAKINLTNTIRLMEHGTQYDYNKASMLFVDKVDDDLVATISLIMLSSYREKGKPYPVIGENAYGLKLRFNITKRTSILYLRKIRIDNERLWEKSKTNVPIINFTQPINNYLPLLSYPKSIILPDELIRDLFFYMGLEDLGVRKSNGERYELYELAWLNRVRDYDKAMKLRELLMEVSYPSYAEINTFKEIDEYIAKKNEEDPLKEIDEYITEKNEEDKRKLFATNLKCRKLVKKYIKTGVKPEKLDEELYYHKLYDKINHPDLIVDKKCEKHYFMNPLALDVAYDIYTLFNNYDIKVNAIKSVKKTDGGMFSWGNEPRSMYTYYNTQGVDEDQLKKDIKENRDLILKAFGSEKNAYLKIRNNGRYDLLRDTARMINQLRSSGYKVSTKGKLEEIHDKLSLEIRILRLPQATFLNSIYEKSQIIDDAVFDFGKTPEDLMLVGNETCTCVGSYCWMCLEGETRIAIGRRQNKVFAILETRIDTEINKEYLVQARGPYNQELSIEDQELVAKFLKNNKIYSKTDLIDDRIADDINNYIEDKIASKANNLNEKRDSFLKMLADAKKASADKLFNEDGDEAIYNVPYDTPLLYAAN